MISRGMKSPLFVSECGSCVYISCLVDGEAAKDDRIGESGEFPGFLVKVPGYPGSPGLLPVLSVFVVPGARSGCDLLPLLLL